MSESIEASDTPASASTPKDTDAKSRGKRTILFALLALTVAAAGGGYYTYWKLVGSRYVSTDDAYTLPKSQWSPPRSMAPSRR
jgi:multidrug resistance efflux pump